MSEVFSGLKGKLVSL